MWSFWNVDLFTVFTTNWNATIVEGRRQQRALPRMIRMMLSLSSPSHGDVKASFVISKEAQFVASRWFRTSRWFLIVGWWTSEDDYLSVVRICERHFECEGNKSSNGFEIMSNRLARALQRMRKGPKYLPRSTCLWNPLTRRQVLYCVLRLSTYQKELTCASAISDLKRQIFWRVECERSKVE